MKRFGLIGYPLDHSFSKSFFEQKFKVENINASYHLYPMEDLSGFKKFVTSNSDILGLNVTIPYKQQIIPFLDQLDDTAEKIGAVNCILIKRIKKTTQLVGYNSDAFGFEASLNSLGNQLPRKALILGTGGASKAVAYVFDQKGIEYLFISRKPDGCKQIRYATINKSVMEDYKLIVNTTPIGMFPDTDQCPDIPYVVLSGQHILFDLIYNPSETLFLKRGKVHGSMIKNGLEMLEQQAKRSWEIWNEST